MGSPSGAAPKDLRALSMGGIFMSLPDDYYGLFYNPSFLGLRKRMRLQVDIPTYGISNYGAVDRNLDLVRGFFRNPTSLLSGRTVEVLSQDPHDNVHEVFMYKGGVVLPYMGAGFYQEASYTYSFNVHRFQPKTINVERRKEQTFTFGAAYDFIDDLFVGASVNYHAGSESHVKQLEHRGDDYASSVLEENEVEADTWLLNLGLAYRMRVKENIFYITALGQNINGLDLTNPECESPDVRNWNVRQVCVREDGRFHVGFSGRLRYSPRFIFVFSTELQDLLSDSFSINSNLKTGMELKVLDFFVRGGFRATSLSGYGAGFEFDPFGVEVGSYKRYWGTIYEKDIFFAQFSLRMDFDLDVGSYGFSRIMKKLGGFLPFSGSQKTSPPIEQEIFTDSSTEEIESSIEENEKKE